MVNLCQPVQKKYRVAVNVALGAPEWLFQMGFHMSELGDPFRAGVFIAQNQRNKSSFFWEVQTSSMDTLRDEMGWSDFGGDPQLSIFDCNFCG